MARIGWLGGVLAASLLACKRDPQPAPVATDNPLGALPAPTTSVPLAASPESLPRSFSGVVKVADASVVTISTLTASPFGRGSNGSAREGLGSGFFIDAQGTLLTNNHVIEGARTVTVRLHDERQFSADVLGTDPRTDLAVLRVRDAGPLTPLVLGDSDAMEVGDWVVAIGNPFGLSHTVSAGIVSGKGRSLDDVPLDPSGYYDFLQTDASINPGNSGGPLLDLKGEVVGINTAIRGGGAQGIGFAVPIAMVKQLLPTLLREGKITRSALGVRVRDVRELTVDERDALSLPGDARGALIEHVDVAGPARGKLRSGDVIQAFEGQSVERAARLQWLASTAGVGKIVMLRVLRDGKPVELQVTLGELPVAPSAPTPEPAMPEHPQAPFKH